MYRVQPGDCSSGSAPTFEKFMGFYPFEIGAGNIADVSAIPGSSRFVAVIERNGFPSGHMWPGAGNPANNLCVVELLDLDENMVMKNKKCILNYHNIDDPWDVDGNGIFKYGHTQVTNEALIVVDDYCESIVILPCMYCLSLQKLTVCFSSKAWLLAQIRITHGQTSSELMLLLSTFKKSMMHDSW